MMEQYENIEDLFPYVEHSLKSICKTVLGSFQFYSERMFFPLKVEGLDKVKELKAAHPNSHFIHISRHNSHSDYIETQLALANARMPARIQAGDNLFIGPLDPLWRELGAFMVIREGRGFYSKDLLLNTFYSLMPKHLGRKYEVYIDMKLSKLLYEAYLNHILSNDEPVKDLLLYPEYIKQQGITKYGRSYSGVLLDFSPYLFILLHRITSKLDKEFFFVPVNPSYERVMEDSFITEIPKLKEKFSRDLVYLQEFAYIVTRPLLPFFRRGEFVLKFGEPYKVINSGNVRADAVSDVKRLRNEVGLLQTPFSPQIIFYSMGGEQKVSLSKLEDRVMTNILKLDEKNIDTSRLKSRGGAKSFDSLLEETLRLFDTPGRRYARVKGNSLEIINSGVVSQYANHIAHLF